MAPARTRGRPALLLVAVLAAALVVPAALLLRPARDPAPKPGQDAPEFSLRRRDGSRLTLGDLAGRPVVLHFCGSWTPECTQDKDLLVEEWRRWGDRIAFVDVLVTDDLESGAELYGELPWPATEDPGGRTAHAYSVDGVPQTFFIGADGKIAARSFGLADPPLDDRLRLLVER